MAPKKTNSSQAPLVERGCVFAAHPDGTTTAIITGKAIIEIHGPRGVLVLDVSGRDTCFSLDDPDKEPGRRFKYKGCWQLMANGRLKGFWHDADGNRQWIPARRPAKKNPKAKTSNR